MFKHVKLLHIHLALYDQVAPLAQGSKVPSDTVAFIIVQMMSRECIAVPRVIGVFAALTFIASLQLNLLAYLIPVWWVVAFELHSKYLTSLHILLAYSISAFVDPPIYPPTFNTKM